ncbi:MAG TPA: cytochrome ubiquinol oxidase subunit I [Vicinamibacterales bacterium]|nr:cytochrome ubiquinol oxidase subunit I [Vicinamibacterales bacterium]HPW20381.1 cytochrome ubiquinol oxidase subunit I [Vicinamibacterales bacterium]
MDTVLLARWQFAITSVYHFFFVPLTLGLVWLVAGMHTAWVVTGRDVWKRLTKFWGRLFLINFAMGVATGIVMEFQFGMNWAEYSRFVGDVFGAPLAIEALLAFFLESTFLGLWVFGWDRLPKKVHLACIWVVAVGSNLSALWILIANSFMQQPVGYVLNNGRAEMRDFAALVFNPHVLVQFPHVITGSMALAGFFVLGISAWQIRRSPDEDNRDAFRRSFRIGAVYALVASLAVAAVGHSQAQHMVRVQPMKMAAAEALWESADPAPLSLFTWGNEPERRDVWAIKAPSLLSFLAYNRFHGEVKGIKNVQADYERRYGPGDYAPPIMWTYWTFRAMVGAGTLMVLLAAWAVLAVRRNRIDASPRLLALLVPAIALPYLAHSTGWIFTEIGRAPWIVFGLYRISDGVSKAVTAGELWLSLAGFTLLYAALMAVDVYLLAKYARAGVGGKGPAAGDHAAAARA